jgi:hypothetical protein
MLGAVEFLAAVPKKLNHMTPKSLPQSSTDHSLRILHRRIKSGCNSRQKTIHIVAAFVPNSCTSTMIRLTSLKELRICVGCVAGMEFMPIVGRKNHWLKVNRWRITANFKAAIDARCAMPTPPRFKRRAK